MATGSANDTQRCPVGVPHELLLEGMRRDALEQLRQVASRLETVDASTPTNDRDQEKESLDRCTARLVHFSARTKQQLRSLRVVRPWLAIILEGTKRIDSSDRRLVNVGEVLVLPTGSTISVTNIPDPDSGSYHALCLEILGDAQALLHRHHPDLSPGLTSWFGDEPHVVVPDLAAIQAFAHIGEGLLLPTLHPRVLHHRLEGLLECLLLAEHAPENSAQRAQARTDLVVAAHNVVRVAPESTWTCELLARKLGVSAATLRRRLAENGTSSRAIVLHERMVLAKALLLDGRADVREVAVRCGYESATKFSRAYARSFGELPSHARRRRAHESVLAPPATTQSPDRLVRSARNWTQASTSAAATAGLDAQ